MTDQIEKQLTELQLRHRLHQQMLDEHHERKHRRREDHRNGIHKRKFAPGALI